MMKKKKINKINEINEKPSNNISVPILINITINNINNICLNSIIFKIIILIKEGYS